MKFYLGEADGDNYPVILRKFGNDKNEQTYDLTFLYCFIFCKKITCVTTWFAINMLKVKPLISVICSICCDTRKNPTIEVRQFTKIQSCM